MVDRQELPIFIFNPIKNSDLLFGIHLESDWAVQDIGNWVYLAAGLVDASNQTTCFLQISFEDISDDGFPMLSFK
jgi:hypothetical protein